MNKYLTTKLIEEGSEVAQAGCKVLLHRDKLARRVLIQEMADMQAVTNLARRRMTAREREAFDDAVGARMRREVDKGKA